MGFLENLQSTLGGVINQTPGGAAAGGPAARSGASSGGGLTDLLGPGLLGGLIGAILPGKSGMLKAGGATVLATMLWNKYKDRLQPPAAGRAAAPPPPVPAPLAAPDGAALNETAARMIRALVFAAKSDGHIDGDEQQAISQRLMQLNAGPAATRLVQQAVDEPLDPNLVAAGVTDPQEAMALFLASCTVINLDHFMESAYLDNLARALGLPDQMKNDIEAEARKQ